MPTTIAFDDLAEKRIHKEVTGGSRWNSYFMQPPKGTRLPQAFLVENTPHRQLRTHFHDVDQFQVIVSGGGTLGKHAVRPYSVHARTRPTVRSLRTRTASRGSPSARGAMPRARSSCRRTG
jgi:hypothetical protein